MPLYEYRCAECGERFEILQPLGAGTEGLSCPHCEGEEVGKVFSTFAAASPSQSVGATTGCAGGGSGFS